MSYRQQRQEQAELNHVGKTLTERTIDKWHAMKRHPSADNQTVELVERLARQRGQAPYEDGRFERTCLYNYRLLEGKNGNA